MEFFTVLLILGIVLFFLPPPVFFPLLDTFREFCLQRRVKYHQNKNQPQNALQQFLNNERKLVKVCIISFIFCCFFNPKGIETADIKMWVMGIITIPCFLRAIWVYLMRS